MTSRGLWVEGIAVNLVFSVGFTEVVPTEGGERGERGRGQSYSSFEMERDIKARSGARSERAMETSCPLKVVNGKRPITDGVADLT